MGLVICRRILDLHHGVISYKSGDGATFGFNLPCRQKMVDSAGDLVEETVKANG